VIDPFRDRSAGAVALARLLTRYGGRSDVSVLGLVRGGVPVAAVLADRLGAPLDVLVVRKLGVPATPEVAFGALGPGGVQIFNRQVSTRLDPRAVADVVRAETAELTRRERRYRAGRPPLDLAGRTALVADDGLATGATARVAVTVARRLGARRVVVAAPVGAAEAVDLVAEAADHVVCPVVPPAFGAVSRYYRDFHQVSDDEVAELLASYGIGVTAAGTVGEWR
jgi:predicted phosphoribosyltransferase